MGAWDKLCKKAAGRAPWLLSGEEVLSLHCCQSSALFLINTEIYSHTSFGGPHGDLYIYKNTFIIHFTGLYNVGYLKDNFLGYI